jgi:LacI family transcriptional regulator
MARSRARLKDIARATGFSANTVSLALRDSPRIPPDTRELILAEAKRQNYLPNQVARSLVSRATRTIGLVLPDIMNPTLTLAARSIERRLVEHGYSMMFTATDNIPAQELKALEIFRSRQVDGILIYPVSHRQLDHLRPLRESGYPMVLLVADPDAGIDVVCINERRGAFKAVSHLLDLGHRRIAILDPSPGLGNSEKFDGYETALKSRAVAVDPLLVIDPNGHGSTSGYGAMAELMRQGERPTAVFAANDQLAIGALSWCRDHGVSVPKDLAIVGFDDIEAASFTDVRLTTMRYAVKEVADHAVRRLLNLIDHGDHMPNAEIVLIEPELVIRDSCGAKMRRARRAPR